MHDFHEPPLHDLRANPVTSHYFLRYFERTVLKCVACSEPGHISSQCYRSLKKCIFCADSSHSFAKCPQSTCYLCKSPGHGFKQCMAKQKCYECNAGGHNDKVCISRKNPCLESEERFLTCLNCKKPGHCNCNEKEGIATLTKLNCFLCGLKGHSADLCPNTKNSSKVDLFKKHVKEAMEEFPVVDKNMNSKERRYWHKVEKKAYKKLVKREKLKKKKKKR